MEQRQGAEVAPDVIKAVEQSLQQHSTEQTTVLYPFDAHDGVSVSGLIEMNGTLYGTASGGGSSKAGTIYAIASDGSEHTLHSFGPADDAYGPVARLLDVAGTLFGTTAAGYGETTGTVFSFSP